MLPGQSASFVAAHSAPGAGPVDSLQRRAGSARQDSQAERHHAAGQAENRSADNNIHSASVLSYKIIY